MYADIVIATCNNSFQWSKVIKHLSGIINPDDNTRDCALRSPALSHVLYSPSLPQPENQDAAAHSSRWFNCEMICLERLYTDKLRDVGRSILNQNGMENTSQGNFEPSGKAYFDRCFPLFGDELEAMETRFGTVNTGPGNLPHSFTSTTQGSLLGCVLGSASKCHLAQPTPFTKRGKYVLWSPPAQAPVSKSGYEFQALHLFCTFHPRGASCLSTTSWLSFFIGDRTADLDIDLPLFAQVAFEGWFTLNTCLVE